jgi:hypothetical protein
VKASRIFSAPTPAKDGKPDFSGVWEVEQPPCPLAGDDDMWIPQDSWISAGA